MVSSVLILAACSVVILFASRLMSRQLVALAEHLHVPAFFVAFLLVSFSTSIPELFVGVGSALSGVPALSLGDVIGANIVDLTFIAGLVILLGRKPINLREHIDPLRLATTFAIASAPVLLLIDGSLSQLDGLVLLALYACYLVFFIRQRPRSEDEPRVKFRGVVHTLALFLLGVALLIIASELIVVTAKSLSATLEIAPFIVGVFALALSTSLPELTFGIRVALERRPELSLADLIGSTAVNSSAILGLVSLIHPIVPVNLSTTLTIGSFSIAVFMYFYLLLARGRVLPTYGAALLLAYLLFVSFHFVVT
jgi:cation:H+ antiporter